MGLSVGYYKLNLKLTCIGPYCEWKQHSFYSGEDKPGLVPRTLVVSSGLSLKPKQQSFGLKGYFNFHDLATLARLTQLSVLVPFPHSSNDLQTGFCSVCLQ